VFWRNLHHVIKEYIPYLENSRAFITSQRSHDENQIKEAFINEGKGHSPSHLKFFHIVFSKLKEDIK